jgi:hypothetical protein
VVLSQRERYMAVGIGVVAGLAIIYYVVISPMTAWSKDLDDRQEKVHVTQEEDKHLDARKRQLSKLYDLMLKGGLKSDVSEAQNQMDRAVYDWAAQSSVIIATASNSGSNTYDPKTGFTEVGYSVTCTGSTVGVAKLLYQIESAAIPIRIKTVTLRARKDGVDDLMVELNLSTLCVAPPKPPTAAPAAPVAAGESQS